MARAFIKSHIDVPALFRLLGTMKADNGGGAVSVDVLTHAPLKVPPTSYHRALASRFVSMNTETAFAGL